MCVGTVTGNRPKLLNAKTCLKLWSCVPLLSLTGDMFLCHMTYGNAYPQLACLNDIGLGWLVCLIWIRWECGL